jgi:GMP synthase (glutamine-hydrolysing)
MQNQSKNKELDRILIIDFGSQYTQLIGRRVRELGVYCEIVPFDITPTVIQEFGASGIILSGGPESVIESTTPRIPDVVFNVNCPVLGICYGMQAMAAQLGGTVKKGELREFGHATITPTADNPLTSGIDDHVNANGQASLDVWMSHGDAVESVPPGFITIGETPNTPIAAMADLTRKFYGLQYHPEVTHTRQGQRILSRFVHEICGCGANWQPEHIVTQLLDTIKTTVGKEHVLLALSGGVDSSVTAALIHRAIGDQLICVFVDHGLLRQGEADQVMAIFEKQQKIRVIRVNAQEQFFNALRGVSDPEQKRKIIGQEFIRVFEDQARAFPDVTFLAQGTIYPDVIESAQTHMGKGVVIKSHHNVGGLPERMRLKLLEPLRELFKDEVRKIGLECGLPHDMVYRHPFPGPGLAVRILGEVVPEHVPILQHADAIFLEELRNFGWYDRVAQAFVVFLPVRSVAVKGDARHYEYVVSLRAVETSDFMTATWAPLPYELLAATSRRIMNEVQGIARVTYDISSKPPATIEWE